ncbi:MAG: Uma2 family endonuclease [Haliscomenobacter sp.]|nr:Uma2 family endonuclease [Haliscomenobacter sp.]MBK7478218.1 Uma2 family endonuclease [Haliscomenobacter sp.]
MAILAKKRLFNLDEYSKMQEAGILQERDREVKRSLYAAAGIPEIWIVNLDKRRIERYRHPENGEYQTAEILPPGESFSLSSFDLQVNVSDLVL